MVLSIGGRSRLGRRGAGLSRAGAADVRPLAVVPDQLLTGVWDVNAKGGGEIQGGAGGQGSTVGAGAAIMILGVIGDPMSLAVIVQAMQSDRGVDTIPGHAFSRLMIAGSDGLALKYREARVPPGEKDIDEPLGDLFLRQERFQELVAKEQHDLDRIGRGNRQKGAVGQDETIRQETVQVRVKAGGIIAIRLNGGDHGWKHRRVSRATWHLHRGIQEDLFDGVVVTAAQLSQEPAIVLEREAEHLGDGDDMLTDGDFAQNVLVDMLGKEQGTLLVA